MLVATARLVGVPLLAAGLICLAPAAEAAPSTCPTDTPSLVNGSFEEPVVDPGFARGVSDEDLPGWSSTDSEFEVWPPGVTEGPDGLNDPNPYTAADGGQFIELNANDPEGVYQDLELQPGPLLLEVFHRGRSNPDTGQAVIGVPGGPFPFREDMDDTPEAWGRYEFVYDVPAGQPTTRVGFVPLDGTTVGNFLDGVRVQRAGCLEATKSAVVLGGRTVPQVGDVIEFRVAVTNAGPAPVTQPVVRDVVPAGTAYLPGSMRVLSGPDAGARTDAADPDGAEASADGVSIGVGTDPGDELAAGATATVAFRVTVAPSAAGTRISNDASVGYGLLDLAGDPIGTARTALSNTVVLDAVAPDPTPTATPSPSATPAPTGPGATGVEALPEVGAPVSWITAVIAGLLLLTGAALVSRAAGARRG